MKITIKTKQIELIAENNNDYHNYFIESIKEAISQVIKLEQKIKE